MKKQGFDKEIPNHYGPLSNFTFVSKILGNVVWKQLEKHLDNDELMDVLQSAYRSERSVRNDILSSLDEKGFCCL